MAEPPSGIVQRTVNELIDRLQAISQLNTKIFQVYSEEDLLNAARQSKKPCLGVMYEGLAPVGDPARGGLSTMLSMALVLISDSNAIGGAQRQSDTLDLLDQMRNVMKEQKATSGHKWAFGGEVSGGSLGNNNLYVQRWRCPAILT